ncbi:uncharacterized protein LOC124363723 [Homalodisca vitripennis]|uniref:uncharacterized protein LOC124363723 n=1 Tax=Homalodisca vitripennis TaxID=197043 RepID=UPI001EECB087|nr:uncharacterized protein LOC124363723 [Homalodisca vitripennis]
MTHEMAMFSKESNYSPQVVSAQATQNLAIRAPEKFLAEFEDLLPRDNEHLLEIGSLSTGPIDTDLPSPSPPPDKGWRGGGGGITAAPPDMPTARRFLGRDCTGDCKSKQASASGSSPTTATVSHRPASSLSLQSSCSSTSSGRMSTGSGTSLGDSGTHSDSDDRKSSEISRHDLRSKMMSGRLYTEIPQRDVSKHKEENEGEKQRLLDCTSSGTAIIKPSYLHRSNSLIQENTIEEEVDESCKSLQDHPSVETSTASACGEKEIAIVDVHNIPCDAFEGKTEEVEEAKANSLPLPPDNLFNDKVSALPQNEEKESERVAGQLIIIEDGESVDEAQKQLRSSPTGSETETKVEGDVEKPGQTGSPKGFVKSIVSFIENENNFNAFDEVDDVCEHILEEADTEVVFELPDYVNLTSPPHPPTSCM